MQSPSLLDAGAGGGAAVVQVSFPETQASVLDSLNRQREEGRLCDLSIQVQGQVFRAHRCVLAASSPYFHDQVLLKNMSTVCIPAAMDPLAFESVLACAYTGQLRMPRDDIVNYLTVGSVLQMWHIVDKCTELLRQGRAAAAASGGAGGGAGGGGGGIAQDGHGAVGGAAAAATVGCPSGHRGATVGGGGDAQRAPCRPALSESQSPSSTNYFSPRDGGGGGGGGAAAGAGPASSSSSGERGGANATPGYCTPSGGEEAFLVEEEEEEEDVVSYHQRKRGKGGGGGRRKKMSLASEQEVGVSDSFGVSSYQDGEAAAAALLLQKRPAYSQPSIMPRKQWVVVKSERNEDDDLIVVSGGEEEEEDEDEEEEGDEEEDEEEREIAMARERSSFNISNVRSLSGEPEDRAEADMDPQVNYCQTSSEEDYLKFESTLVEQSLAQHLHDSAALQAQHGHATSSRVVSALLGQVQSAARTAQLFPLDMQGNQILLYGQSASSTSSVGLSLEPGPPGSIPSLGHGGLSVGGGGMGFKGPALEHGAVHAGTSGEGPDAGGNGNSGGGAGGGKVFMCHCGKTFTHKSMRDRHINMHLDLRPFHCPVCAKRFKMKHHLTEHMKTHTGLRPYDCPGCGRKFMWRDSFMRHRAHCEKHGGGGAAGEEGLELHDHHHHHHNLLLSPGEGGRTGTSVLSPQHASNSTSSIAAASQAQGPGAFGGLVAGGRGSVSEGDVADIGDAHSLP